MLRALIGWVRRHPVRAGALAGWYQQFAGGVVLLAIVPIVNARLSVSEAALWFSFQSLAAAVTLTDFGIGFAISRQVAYSLSMTTSVGIADFISTRPGWAGVSDIL